MSGIRGVLFDKDGTLIDFRRSWLAAYRQAAAELAARAGDTSLATLLLQRLGYDPHGDRFDADSPLLWATNREIATAWAAQDELAIVADSVSVVEQHFADMERYPPVAVGHLPPLLSRLADRGLRLGLATMDLEDKARSTAASLGIDGHLDMIVGADSGHGEKPEPGMVLAFARATGLDTKEIMVVGDTRADLAMARAADCGLAVGVLTGGCGRDALGDLADHVLDSVMDIERLF